MTVTPTAQQTAKPAAIATGPKPVAGYLRGMVERVISSRRFAFLVFTASVISGFATFMALSATPGSRDTNVTALLYLDLVLLLLLSVVVLRRVATMWSERRRGKAGSATLARLVTMFSLLAVTPAIIVAVFAALFMNFGVHAWFSERVKTAIESSSAVANSYLEEHLANIRADTFAMANDINRSASTLADNRVAFDRFLSTQAGVRNLPEALVVDGSGQVLAKSQFSMSIEFDLVSKDVIDRARNGEIVILTSRQDDRVRAVVKLDRFIETYLLVGRFVDSGVMEHISANSSAAQLYKSLEEKSGSIQITFVAIFVVVSLLLLLAAMWIGMAIANQMVMPISSLIEASQNVSSGNLDVHVDTNAELEELSTLSRAFNEMTGQIKAQQAGLLEMNQRIDERMRFTETVLAGVSAGVIGLDHDGSIHLPNRSASELLETDLNSAIGRKLEDVVPEIKPLLTRAMQGTGGNTIGEINVAAGAVMKTLIVNIASETDDNATTGYVVTFDDITELQSAQRKAAWSDVARRIAHEIKNPLTPIQLAAERLRRRYLKQIADDPETFDTCTDTIIRQVEELGRMVDEFSSFARMPQAVIQTENVSELCRQAIFLERNRHPDISFESSFPDEDTMLQCDARQVSRALGNVLKNAAESVAEKMAENPDNDGKVKTAIRINPGSGTTITVEDSGAGLPGDSGEKLTEPYVTTREKGTGLGLAIVRKIMEDHGGSITLENRDGGGAKVTLAFPDGQGDVRAGKGGDDNG